ncbi:MAG: M20/M25/M40 family metallo-hydrolase [Chloroflexi bacterium]|nr:M20/M25/M40 family metallo-hydrolase [Chloroflexota bacterium]
MINQQRLRDYFLELVKIDSESRHERQVALKLWADLEALGATVVEDDAGSKIGSDSGNLIAVLKGNRPDVPPLLLSAHMDTVVPGKSIKPVVEGDIVRTDGATILGGDDKSGVAALMEAVRCAREQGLPLSDLEVVFTICEEKGLLGAKEVDVSRLRSRYGLVLDSDQPGVLFTRAPAADHMEFRVYGLEAHAGVAPERGLSAIKVAAEAIAQMRLGRIDFETTANIGVINGGAATNIIPNQVVVHGEARSRSLEKLEAQTRHMVGRFEEAAARHSVTLDGKTVQARVEPKIIRAYDAMNVPDDAPIVRLVQEAAAALGGTVPLKAMGGGCDANVFNGKGLSVANLGTGMRDIHTTSEWLDFRDLEQTAELLLEVVRRHSTGKAL